MNSEIVPKLLSKFYLLNDFNNNSKLSSPLKINIDLDSKNEVKSGGLKLLNPKQSNNEVEIFKDLIEDKKNTNNDSLNFDFGKLILEEKMWLGREGGYLGNSKEELTMLNKNNIIKKKKSSIIRSDIQSRYEGAFFNEFPKTYLNSPFYDEKKYASQSNSLSILSDISSPRPIISFSPISRISFCDADNLKNILEELIESEEVYISCMCLLKNFYLDPFILNHRSGVATPIYLIHMYLEQLIVNHKSFLCSIKNHLRKWHNFVDVLVQISTEMLRTGFEINVYEEYCNIYEDVLMLVNDEIHTKDQSLLFNKSWTKSLEFYLECTQPASKKLDLSFISLIQKPIARIGKYKLILEFIFRHLKSKSRALFEINLNLVKERLILLNEKINHFKSHDKTNKLNDVLNFKKIKYKYKISLQFFGKCLLIGSSTAVWIEETKFKYKNLGCFLYKSHLILAELFLSKKKGEILFIICLTKCKLFSSENGLYTTYPYSTKILFESGSFHYELMLLFILKKEFDIWKNFLTTLIDFVNGPSVLNFSHSDFQPLLVYPQSMTPFKISPKIFTKALVENQYYDKKKFLYVVISLFPIKKNTVIKNDLLLTFLKKIVYKKKNFPNQNQNQPMKIIIIKKIDRIKIEKKLSALWSMELPKFENS